MRIAVDFDGVIVENRYPEIGEEIPYAFQLLKKLQKNGHHIILWTHRNGIELKAALRYCHERGLRFFAVNQNYPGETFMEGASRKIRADLYIEGHFFLDNDPRWEEIYWYIYWMGQD